MYNKINIPSEFWIILQCNAITFSKAKGICDGGPRLMGDTPASPLLTYLCIVDLDNCFGALGESDKLCFITMSRRDNVGESFRFPVFFFSILCLWEFVANLNYYLYFAS